MWKRSLVWMLGQMRAMVETQALERLEQRLDQALLRVLLAFVQIRAGQIIYEFFEAQPTNRGARLAMPDPDRF
jgi:hypothetical protein